MQTEEKVNKINENLKTKSMKLEEAVILFKEYDYEEGIDICMKVS